MTQRSAGFNVAGPQLVLTEEQIAAKELGIAAFTDRNFTVAFIPEERLHVHLKK
jgi:hypothetical protein